MFDEITINVHKSNTRLQIISHTISIIYYKRII